MQKWTMLPCLVVVLILTLAYSAGSQQAGEKSAPPDPAHIQGLVKKLNSSTFTVREQAARELDKVGPAALVQLREAAKGGETEGSRRAAELVSRIEERMVLESLLTPKRLRLNVKDATVSAAVAELAKLSGYKIDIAATDRKVTLDTGDVMFWEALEQLCKAADLVEKVSVAPAPANMGVPKGAGGGGVVVVKIPIGPKKAAPPIPAFPGVIGGNPNAVSPATIQLAEGKAADVPVRFTGSVRVRALPAVAGGKPLAAGQTQIVLDVAAEPRLLKFGMVGVPRILKAVDDQDQVLTVVPEPNEPPANQPNPGGMPGGINLGGGGILIINGQVIQGGGAGNPQAPVRRNAPIRFNAGAKPAKMLQELSGDVVVQTTLEGQRW